MDIPNTRCMDKVVTSGRRTSNFVVELLDSKVSTFEWNQIPDLRNEIPTQYVIDPVKNC